MKTANDLPTEDTTSCISFQDSSWAPLFDSLKQELSNIADRLSGLPAKHTSTGIELPGFFPAPENVFRFTAIPADRIKGIVVGMDPYPSYTIDSGVVIPEATGRSFEVASVCFWDQKFRQSSLRNILKSIYAEITGSTNASLELIRSEISAGHVHIPQPHVLFDTLEPHGIMFLNASLTVEPGKPGSHEELWSEFGRELAGYITQTSPDACWMLFGTAAQYRFENILKSHNASMVKACHPRLPQFVTEEPFKEIRTVIRQLQT